MFMTDLEVGRLETSEGLLYFRTIEVAANVVTKRQGDAIFAKETI
jgi:hypothetical protein